ncbi:hypothetical protein Tco_0513611 [Tanacetum coccineum]
MSSDSASSEDPDSPEAAPASPDNEPGPEEPEQVPLSPNYMPGPECLEYLAPSNEEVPVEDQPYAIADSPIALSLGYVADSDPEEDSADGLVDYPTDGGDGDDDDSSDNDEEEEASEEEEEEEHLALANSVVDHVPSFEETKPFKIDESAATPPSPPVCRTTARISTRPKAPMPFLSEEEVKRLLALSPPPPSPFISLSPPSAEERLARAAMGRLRASSPSTHYPLHPSPPLLPPPSSLHLPPHVPTSLPLPSSPLPPLPASLFIPPHGFIGTLDAKTRRQRAREVWEDTAEAVEEVAPTTLKGVNARVTELAAVQEQDTQDVYVVIEDTFDRQTQLFQRVDGLVEDGQFYYETARLLDQEALVSREAWAYSVGLSSAVHYELQAYRTHTQMHDFRIASQESLALQARGQTYADDREGAASTTVGLVFSFLVSDNHNNMPPRRSSATARAAATAARAAVVAAAPMTAAAFEQLIEARVSAALANHETL